MEITLKPCPFCGGRADKKAYEAALNAIYNICCPFCFANSGTFRTAEMAIEAWNRRAGKDHRQARIGLAERIFIKIIEMVDNPFLASGDRTALIKLSIELADEFFAHANNEETNDPK